MKVAPHTMDQKQLDSLCMAVIAMDEVVAAFMGNRDQLQASIKARQILFDIYNANQLPLGVVPL